MKRRRITKKARDLLVSALDPAHRLEMATRDSGPLRNLRKRGLMTWLRCEIRGEDVPELGVYRVEIVRLTPRGVNVARQIADARACRRADPPRPAPSGDWPAWVRRRIGVLTRADFGGPLTPGSFRARYAETRGLAPEPHRDDMVWRRLVDDRIARELAGPSLFVVPSAPAEPDLAFFAGADHDPGDEDDGAAKSATHYHCAEGTARPLYRVGEAELVDIRARMEGLA